MAKFLQAIRLLLESFRFALQALGGNLLRTVLSLLGVTMGIFAIAGVLTLVDSMERSIRDHLTFLGERTIYIDKWPWGGYSEGYQWWDYLKRPDVSYREYRELKDHARHARAISYRAKLDNQKLTYGNFSATDLKILGVSQPHFRIQGLEPAAGRVFSPQEAQTGQPVMVVGAAVAENLFPNGEALGRSVKVRGIPVRVIGVLPQMGEGAFSFSNQDEEVYLPYRLFAKLFAAGEDHDLDPQIALMGKKSDENLQKLEGELHGLMRSIRGLRPREKDNFALNRPEMLTKEVQKIFAIISSAGWVIGSFSILVGAFGIANIMFVSVKERTSLIGIQKALGAKNAFILSQFLFEAVFLSLIGGAAGIFLVYLVSIFPQDTMEIRMSSENILNGFVISLLTGLLAGFFPAWSATRLDPVEAIRR